MPQHGAGAVALYFLRLACGGASVAHQHISHPLGFETSRLHKLGNACLSQTPVVVVEWLNY